MLAFEVFRNNKLLARGCGRNLFGIGFHIAIDGCAEPSSTGVNANLTGEFRALMSLRGSGLEQVDLDDIYFDWIPKTSLSLSDTIEVHVVDTPSDTSSISLCPEEVTPIKKSKRPEAIIGLEFTINSDKPILIGANRVDEIDFDIVAVGFLGPDSLGNQAYRENGITSGMGIGIDVHGINRDSKPIDLLRWFWNKNLSVGDVVKIRMVEGCLESALLPYQILK